MSTPEAPPSPEAPAEGGTGAESTAAVLFVIVCLCIGAFSKHFLAFTRIPYTAMLLLWGVAIGFLQLAPKIVALESCVAFTQTLYLWMGMEPQLLLLIFLPTIGFSAAIAQEPHMLRRNWGQIMVLAWPGVVISFAVIAICAKYFFPYGWDWSSSFLFGAMMSATDPVAVVAVLQEVGASQKLASVIDGESLMNDGSALVIFTLLKAIADGQSLTVAQGVLMFVQLAIVGICLGIGFGLATSFWLKHIHADTTLTIIVTLLSAYASFFTAEELCGASGLLSVVLNGFTCSVFGGRQVTLRVEHSMHAFWGALEWIANTILFIWMGIVFAFVIQPPPFITTEILDGLGTTLTGWDVGYAVVLYLWLLVVRALLIAICYYPFMLFGYPMDWRTAIVFTWSGLRGAVGMVMALYIFLDSSISSQSYKSHCVYYMAVMALATVLINGTTIKAMLQGLGFMSHTPQQLGVLEHVVKGMEGIREKHLASLEPNDLLGDPDCDAVRMWAHVDTAKLLDEVRASLVPSPLTVKEIERASRHLYDDPKRAQDIARASRAIYNDPTRERLTNEHLQIVYDYRVRLLRMVKTFYAELFNENQVELDVVQSLREATDKAIDKASMGLRDWRYVEQEAALPAWARWMQSLESRAKFLHSTFDAFVNTALISSLSTVSTFIAAHVHAQHALRNHIREITGIEILHGGSIASSSVVTGDGGGTASSPRAPATVSAPIATIATATQPTSPNTAATAAAAAAGFEETIGITNDLMGKATAAAVCTVLTSFQGHAPGYFAPPMRRAATMPHARAAAATYAAEAAVAAAAGTAPGASSPRASAPSHVSLTVQASNGTGNGAAAHPPPAGGAGSAQSHSAEGAMGAGGGRPLGHNSSLPFIDETVATNGDDLDGAPPSAPSMLRTRMLASEPSVLAGLVSLVLAESETEIEVAKRFCERLVVPHPSLPSWLRSRNVAAAILTKQQEFVASISEAGLVEPREITRLQEELDAAYRNILSSQSVLAAAMRFAGQRVDVNDLPLFESLTAAECKELLQHSKWRLLATGAELCRVGDEVNEVTVLCEGTCLLEFPAREQQPQGDVGGKGALDQDVLNGPHSVIASVGDPLGLAEVMLGCRRLYTAHVDTPVHCLVVPLPALLAALRGNAGAMRRAWQATAAHLAAQHNDILGVCKQLAPLNLHFRACDLVRCKPRGAAEVHHTAVLIMGSVVRREADASVAPRRGTDTGPDAAPPSRETFIAPCELSRGHYEAQEGGATLAVVPREMERLPRNALPPRVVARRRRTAAAGRAPLSTTSAPPR